MLVEDNSKMSRMSLGNRSQTGSMIASISDENS